MTRVLAAVVKNTKSVMGLGNNNRKRATAIIVQDDKILLIERIKPGMKYYVIPGGGVDDGETIEEGLIREVAEELSLHAEEFKLISTVENIKMPAGTTIHSGTQSYYFFHITKYSGELALGGEEKESMNDDNQYHFVWLPLSEVILMENLYPIEVVPVLAEYFRKV